MPTNKPRRTKKTHSALLSAVQFVAQAAKAEGEPFETHISLNSGSASFSNRILSLSAPISEDITACPRVHPFIKALERVGPNFSLTVAPGSVVIAGGGMRFTVPSMEALGQPVPDPFQAVVGPSLMLGLKTVLAATGPTLPVIEFGPKNTFLATNGLIVLEYHHGLSLPPINIPKEVAELDFNPVGIGLGQHSFTLWAEDGRWVRSSFPTQKIQENMRRVFGDDVEVKPLPKELKERLKTISDFSEDGFIRFRDGELWTHEVKERGASVDIAGIEKGPSYAVANLAILTTLAHSANFGADRCFFYGENVRGLMIGDKRV